MLQFSLEFFPPRNSEASEKLEKTLSLLLPLKPAYCSVTFGAGGSTQEGTLETVKNLQGRGMTVAPHLSCISSSKREIKALVENYLRLGIRRLVALRGDVPSGSYGHGELRYANELVAFLREEFGDILHLEVGAYPEMHPQAKSFPQDLAHFIRKVQAGANAAITQYFFNAAAYFDFVDRVQKQGVSIPIYPGIMPITNAMQLIRFSDACGADIPRWIRKHLDAYAEDKAALLAFGESVVTRLCEDLLAGGAPGLHFYTLNQSAPVLALWKNLKLADR
jgi:methylenetetrahydrofolate reductase (NADPH)